MCGGSSKKSSVDEPSDHALGWSRGGFTTKIHILCDSQGHPLAFVLTSGATHESTALIDLLNATDAIVDADGEPIAWPVALAGDKGYRADWIDETLLEVGIRPVIPSKSNEHHDTRLIEFDRDTHRRRNIFERLISWLKESRRIMTRFEKTSRNFAGMIKLAFILRYLKLLRH